MDGLEFNYLIHKLSLWPVVFSLIPPARGSRSQKTENISAE